MKHWKTESESARTFNQNVLFPHFAINSCVRKLILTERKRDEERGCNGWGWRSTWSLIPKDTLKKYFLILIIVHCCQSLTLDIERKSKDWERAWNEESALWAAAVCGPWVRGKETAEEVRIGRAWLVLVLAQDHPHHILSSPSSIGSSCTSWHHGKYSYSIIVSFSTLGLVHHPFSKIEW